MKNIERKELIIMALAFLAICTIIVLAYFAPLQKSKYVHIVSEVGISQEAAENTTGMETIKVHGTFWNDGNLVAKNLVAAIIFEDAANNKVVRKNIPIGGDLPPNTGSIMSFDSEYTREKTNPETDVNITIQYDWMENGQSRNTLTPVHSAQY
jgi:hypothetical protein